MGSAIGEAETWMARRRVARSDAAGNILSDCKTVDKEPKRGDKLLWKRSAVRKVEGLVGGFYTQRDVYNIHLAW